MEGVRGVVGFDLVLGRETCGRAGRRGRETCAERLSGGETCVERLSGGESCVEQDSVAGEYLVTVVEVNPRLTSSYLGLREFYDNNLTDCLLRLVGGEPLGDSLSPRSREKLSWRLD
jgi:predicted ATP-grasp superfamily ATP-dependent carboligase